MPFDGNGNYTPPSPPDFPAVAGQRIMSARYNAVISDLAVALNNVLTRDSQSAPTANIDFGGFKGVNADDGTDPTDVATVGQMEAALLAQMMERAAITTAVDLDTVTVTGIYPITSMLTCTNGPTVATAGYIPDNNNAMLLVLGGTGSDFVVQVLFGYTERRVYTRMYTTTWTSWKMIGRPGGTIASGVNIDLYTTPGLYTFTDAAMAASTNRPAEVIGASIVAVSVGGVLKVESWSSSFVKQFYYRTDTGVEYTRFFNGTVWGPWTSQHNVSYVAAYVPVVSAGFGSVTPTYTFQDGHYWRHGPFVYFTARISFSHDTTWDDLRISVPVTPADPAVIQNQLVQVEVLQFESATDAIAGFFGRIMSTDPAEALQVRYYTKSGNVSDELGGSYLFSPTTIRVSGWYIAGV